MDHFERYVDQVLDKRYRIVKVLGIGGMAVVFEATDLLMRRSVAVKMLKEEIEHDTQSVKRFINESKAVAMLSHPNIVNIFDVSVKDDHKYIVMELVDGITLKKYIQRKGKLSLTELESITEQILLALEHAHSKGIVHRDIKPQNIMILKNGTVKVADFGIAKLPNAETLTMNDKAIGTVFYISPEQASGKPIDHRSDIYSLGVTMYEMATGKLPFVADSPVSVAIMQVKNTPKPPREIMPSLPQGLEQLILCAMEKMPVNRFQNASQMLKHIRQLRANPQTVFKFTRTAESSRSGEADSKQSGSPNIQQLNHRRSSRSMFPVIAGVTSAFFIVCCISAIVVLTKLFDTSGSDVSKTITVTNMVGAIYSDDLAKQLESQHYDVEVEFVYDEETDRNVIIAQEPAPDSQRKIIPGKQLCALKLTVSYGAETFELGDYVYTDSRNARIELLELGLTPDIVKEPHEYISEGCVIRTAPEAGTVVKSGDSVTLYVSSGQNVEYVKMPDFLKCNEQAVITMLGWYKLELGNVTYEYSESVNEGCVISQNRAVGAETPVGTKVDFVMSLGPKPIETEKTAIVD